MMDRTLYDPIIGHSRLKEQFARLIDEDRFPHAMIFAGPADGTLATIRVLKEDFHER